MLTGGLVYTWLSPMVPPVDCENWWHQFLDPVYLTGIVYGVSWDGEVLSYGLVFDRVVGSKTKRFPGAASWTGTTENTASKKCIGSPSHIPP